MHFYRMIRKLSNDELGRPSVDEFRSAEKAPLVIVLDNIRSMNNVGSVFRSADAFNVERIILAGITARPPHREIQKTALGATESVSWSHEDDVCVAMKNLRDEGYIIIAIEQTDPVVSLADFVPDLKEKYALIFGNEVFGVNDEVVKSADACIEIPQHGTKHSLNVAVSTGIVLWDITAKLKSIK